MSPTATARAEAATSTPAQRREQAFWRVFHHLSGEIAELERDLVTYRDLLQHALAQNAVLVDENRRLRRSAEAEAAFTGSYPR